MTSPLRRRRARTRALVVTTGLMGAWLLSLGLAYRAGTAEQAGRAAQLEQELGLRDRLVRELSGQAETARQRSGELAKELARVRAVLPELAAPELTRLVDERLRDGVREARLRAAIAAVPALRCSPQEVRDVRVKVGKAPVAVAKLADGRVTATAQGVAARDAKDRTLAWADLQQPIEFTLAAEGQPATVQATLPATHTVSVGGREYRLAFRPAGKRGIVEVALVWCEGA